MEKQLRLVYLFLNSRTKFQTDRQTHKRTDGRYQLHYLPRFAVDNYVQKLLHMLLHAGYPNVKCRGWPLTLRPSLINSLFLIRGRVGFGLFRKKKKPTFCWREGRFSAKKITRNKELISDGLKMNFAIGACLKRQLLWRMLASLGSSSILQIDL